MTASTEKRFLVLSLSNIGLAVGPNHEVLAILNLAEASRELGLDIELALQLAPAEAREFAARLASKADEAESSSSRSS